MKLRNALLRIVLISTAFALSGCGEARVEYVQTRLSAPESPAIPRISDAELSCTSDNVYGKLSNMHLILTNHIEKLEAIIKTTHGETNGE